MFNNNIWPNSATLQDISLQNQTDLEFYHSRSLKVKCDDVIGLAIHCFLLIYTGITCDNTCINTSYHYAQITKNRNLTE